MSLYGYDLTELISLPAPEIEDMEVGPYLANDVLDIAMKLPHPPVWRISPTDNIYMLDLLSFKEQIFSSSIEDRHKEVFKTTFSYKMYELLVPHHKSGLVLFESASMILKMKTPILHIFATKEYISVHPKVSLPIQVASGTSMSTFNLYAKLTPINSPILERKLRSSGLNVTFAFPQVNLFIPPRMEKRVSKSFLGHTVFDSLAMVREKYTDQYALKIIQDINNCDNFEIVLNSHSPQHLLDLFEVLVTAKIYPSYTEECLLYFIEMDSFNKSYKLRRFSEDSFVGTAFEESFNRLFSYPDNKLQNLQNRIVRLLDDTGVAMFDGRTKVNIDRMQVISDIVWNSEAERSESFNDYFGALRRLGLVSTNMSMYDIL